MTNHGPHAAPRTTPDGYRPHPAIGPRILIEWPDGTVDVGMKYTEIFSDVMGTQMRPYRRNEFRRELARRAKLWADERLDVGDAIDDVTTKEFLASLARTEMITIYEDGVDITTKERAIRLAQPEPLPDNVIPFPRPASQEEE